MARIIMLSGSPGTGKSSISSLLARNAANRLAVRIHVDDFYEYICKGYIAPWLDGSGDQNETVVEAVAASAERFAADGYETYVDGVIGPWFIEPWKKLAGKGFDVRYIVLRPDEQTTVTRVANRTQNEYFPLDEKVVRDLWRSLSDLGVYEPHAVDTTAQTAEESAAVIQAMLREGCFRI